MVCGIPGLFYSLNPLAASGVPLLFPMAEVNYMPGSPGGEPGMYLPREAGRCHASHHSSQ